ncbi:MAG: hypothetical protein ACPG4X_15785 [Pikeienuella sp.]
MTPQKTFKREAALAMLALLGCLFIWALISEKAHVMDAAKFLTTFVFIFAGGAFGMDAVAKQFK